MTNKDIPTNMRPILIIGGGVIGCSIAYYLTHHRSFDPKTHHIIILEAKDIASAASGKAGGVVGAWATPRCLAKLSYDLHAQLAQDHRGEGIWGYRKCVGWDMEWRSDKVRTVETRDVDSFRRKAVGKNPPGVDWLKPDVVERYQPLGNPTDSAQVHPFIFTKKLPELSKAKRAEVICAKAERLNYPSNKKRVESVTIKTAEKESTLVADDVVVAAGPWTTKLIPGLKLSLPRSHSIVVRCSRMLSPNVLFPVSDQENSTSRSNGTFPEIYTRPPDALRSYPTVYTCGPEDYELELPRPAMV